MIIAVLMLPVAFGFAALAVEGGLWYSDQHSLRNMADSAALAASWTARDDVGDDPEDFANEAAEVLGLDADMDSVVVNNPPSSGAYTTDDAAYEVIITRQRPLAISTLFLDGTTIDIVVRAVARTTTRSAYCVLALSGNEDNAINFSGGPNVTLDGCGINANSTSDSAINMSGNASLTADWAQTHGQIDQSNNATLDVDEPLAEHTNIRPDPFADLPIPAQPAACPGGNVSSYSPCTFSSKTFNSGDNITLQPGTYFVNGDFRLNGGATLSGTGVTLYFTDTGTIRVNGGATLSLTAPNSGTYAGMAIMQSGTAPDGVTNRFNGGSTMDIQGAIYFPNQDLEFTGGNALGGNGCTRIVSNTVTFTGNAEMGNNCTGLGLPDTIVDDPVLVE